MDFSFFSWGCFFSWGVQECFFLPGWFFPGWFFSPGVVFFLSRGGFFLSRGGFSLSGWFFPSPGGGFFPSPPSPRGGFSPLPGVGFPLNRGWVFLPGVVFRPRFWESTLNSARLGCGGATTLSQWLGAQHNSYKALYFLGEPGRLHPHGGCPSPRGCCTIGGSIKGASSHPLLLGSGCRSQGFNADHELEPPSLRLVLTHTTGPDTFEPGTLRQGWQHEDSS